jgi:hypothetical protein
MTTLGRREKCLRNRSEKGPLPALRCPPEPKPAPPGAAGNTVDQNRLKPCRERPAGLYRSWNRRVKTEIPADIYPVQGVHSTDAIIPSNN